MCGIAGIVNFDGAPVESTHLQAMIARLRHRGPDECGIATDKEAGLGHARLSIIDLSGGRQPMQTADGRFTITFNGEIFNYLELRDELLRAGYRFSTQSDTEVILHLYGKYGERCVEHLNGQWSFAIWDRGARALFASRDRVGVRPFFYAHTPRSFLFASEVKALFACREVPRELNLEALDQIFTFWVTLTPTTIFRGIQELPPGHSLLVKQGTVCVSPYWRLEYEPECTADGRDQVNRKSEELLALLTDATRIRLRADVPVGAYLSGGLDSTLTTSLIRRVYTGRLKTFSVSFADAEYDESSYQREASAFLGTEHEEVRCAGADIADNFAEVVYHTETPVLRTAPAPLFLLSALVRQRGFKVVVTGEGSDEVFGASMADSRWRPLLLKRLYPYMKNLQSQSPAFLKSFFRVSAADCASPFFSHVPRWETTSKIKMFFSPEVKTRLERCRPYAQLQSELPAAYASWPAFCQAQYLEAAHLLPGYILSSQGDRMAMAHSVEGRYPFLDYRVIEFAAKLPPVLKMKVLNEKYLLKCAAAGLVPESVRRRAKQPYRAPDGKSFFADARTDLVADMLSVGTLRRDGIFDPDAVGRLVQKFQTGAAIGVRDDMALLGILSTQLVVDQFIDRDGGNK
jgi:asparagine synthase (glutamine-hydrolysing)